MNEKMKPMKSLDGSGLPDAHAHIGSEAELRERIQGAIPTLVSIGSPKEAERFARLLENEPLPPCLTPTYGLHPWQAASWPLKQMEPYLAQAAIIGEIGMDSVWCDVPLAIQEQVFVRQLSLASAWKKPVVLHTKGQEAAIARLIQDCPNRYLVHWYSAGEHLDAYLALGCYVSIGPDVWWNPAVQSAARQVPADRILIETDGMGAVRWAYEEAKTGRPCPETVGESLEQTLCTAAELRGCSPDMLRRQVWENFRRFTYPAAPSTPD